MSTATHLILMESIEFQTHSFIIKIWLEEVKASGGGAIWRGHITHVPSGERRYIQSLADIDHFIVQHLHSLGVRIRPPSRLSRFLGKLIRRDRHG